MQIWAESGKSALPICNYSQILYQFLTFTQNLKRSQISTAFINEGKGSADLYFSVLIRSAHFGKLFLELPNEFVFFSENIVFFSENIVFFRKRSLAGLICHFTNIFPYNSVHLPQIKKNRL